MFAGISKLMLIALLLLGQASVMAHELDLEAHQTGETCEDCLLHSPPGDDQAASTGHPLVAGDYSRHFIVLPSPSSISAFNRFQPRAPH